jgi:hypothetical protein
MVELPKSNGTDRTKTSAPSQRTCRSVAERVVAARRSAERRRSRLASTNECAVTRTKPLPSEGGVPICGSHGSNTPWGCRIKPKSLQKSAVPAVSECLQERFVARNARLSNDQRCRFRSSFGELATHDRFERQLFSRWASGHGSERTILRNDDRAKSTARSGRPRGACV